MGIGRIFRIFDTDKTKSLGVQEFKNAITDMRVGLTDRDIERLFKIFDNDQSG